ncbi:hypothetical protein BKA70DRAFT_1221873 [Coprinopsis sp. MPI-PUGE-AT-0042]|nr:hypothetical protein BKA70DRAFT_1221873 [Coprinopsis sp. MPI-PUGE-AT-0042]
MVSESSETEFSSSSAAAPAQGAPRLGMAPEARYQHNLKVLRRRDPTILSIFDQFSHICLYKLENQKWERTGCEGSMFLFESSTYPPYGYYILNRTGNQDYIARLYPEDWLSGVGSMTAIRHFDAFTDGRLASVKSLLRPGEPLPGPFDERYLVPDVEKLSESMKTTAEHSMVGLWYHAGGIESYNLITDEMNHTQKSFGTALPIHPLPNSLRAVTRGGSSSAVTTSTSESESESTTLYSKSPPPPAGQLGNQPQNQLANLLAGLSRSTAPVSPPAVAQTNNAIDSLFANALATTRAPVPPTPPAAPPMLTALFASASAPQQPLHAPIPGFNHQTTSNGSQPHILSNGAQPQLNSNGPQYPGLSNGPAPQPRNGPQILDQTVLNTLMGGVPRSASAASMRSHATSRDGDNEGGSDDDGSPTSAAGYPPRDVQVGYHASARPVGQGFLSVPGLGVGGGAGGGGIRGDATPRAFQTTDLKGVPAPSVIESVSSIATVRPSSHQQAQIQQQHNGHQQHGQQQQQHQAPRVNRPLVPFADDSELWPYPNESTGDSSSPEIVELSFEETNLLSDPEALFSKHHQQQQTRRNGVNGIGLGINGAGVNGSGRKHKRSRRKESGTRRERDAAEREEIERSWDVPDYVAAQGGGGSSMAQAGYAANYTGQATRQGDVVSPPTSPSPPPSVPQTHKKTAVKKGPISDAAAGVVNGTGKGKVVLNGVNGKHTTTAIDKNATKNAIVGAMNASDIYSGKMGKDEFVRGVLELVQNDKVFVDSLYQQYLSGSN